MPMSMTGYGAHTFDIEGTQFTIEMRSVNNRYLDIVTKMPRSFMYLEVEMKKIIQTYFQRGRIEFFLTISGESLTNKAVQLDWDLLEQYMKKLQDVQSHYSLQMNVSTEALMMIDGVFTIDEDDIISDDINETLKKQIHLVCRKLKEHRISEGVFLLEDIEKRIDYMSTYVEEVAANQKTILAHYRQRLLERIREHLDNQIEVDDSVLIKDVAVLAEKGDITEEVTRLKSHLEHFVHVIKSDEVIGRKLDFIAQEMLREVNTIGSKSVDAHLSELVVKMKSEVEKIKEQIQNIE